MSFKVVNTIHLPDIDFGDHLLQSFHSVVSLSAAHEGPHSAVAIPAAASIASMVRCMAVSSCLRTVESEGVSGLSAERSIDTETHVSSLGRIENRFLAV